MPVISKSSVVPYTTEQMFVLVDEIEHYASFIPWCDKSEVHSRDEDEVRATLQFSAAGMSKSFTTCNRLQRHKMIEIRLENGPFKHLEGFWRFEEEENNHSKVLLDMEFEFANHFLGLAFGSLFGQVANTLVDSFAARAKEVYGDPA